MHEILISCEILHMDETRIQVNKEEGRLPNTNSFMWVIQSGACEKLNATFFYYSRNRNKKVALDLLKGFRGYLTTDAYNVYEYLDMEGIQHNFCWAHVRRKFIESIPLDTKGKEIPGSKGDEARGYIDSQMSRNEIESSKDPNFQYLIYRVYNLNPKTRECSIKIYSGPVTEDAFKLEPAKVAVYQK